MKYQEWRALHRRYIKSWAFTEKVVAVFDREKEKNGGVPRCQRCRRGPETLDLKHCFQVHHVKYPAPELFGREPLEWLELLCPYCHKIAERPKNATLIPGREDYVV